MAFGGFPLKLKKKEEKEFKEELAKDENKRVDSWGALKGVTTITKPTEKVIPPEKPFIKPTEEAYIIQAETGKKKVELEEAKFKAARAPWEKDEKPKFGIELPGARARREREQILSQLSVPERVGYLQAETERKRKAEQFAEQERTSRGVRRAETVRRLLKYSPAEATGSALATAQYRQLVAERAQTQEQRLAFARQQRQQQVMPTAMQVIGKTPFEQQAQERASPQGRDYSQFTQGVGMNIPSAAGGETAGGVGERLGSLLRPAQRGVTESGQLTGGRDYGAMFGIGNIGSRFGGLLHGGPQSVRPQQGIRPQQGMQGKVAPRQADENRFGGFLNPIQRSNKFAKLLGSKKKKKNAFSW